MFTWSKKAFVIYKKLEISNSKLFEKCINTTKYDEQIKNQKTSNPRIEDFILKEDADSVCQDHVRKELPVSEHTPVLECFQAIADSFDGLDWGQAVR